MRPSSPLSRVLTAVLVAVVPTTLVCLAAGECRAQTVLPVGTFRSVTLRNGGEVILRHGSSQRVTALEGSATCAIATIVDGDRLVIDHRHGECGKGHELSVEILTPDLDAIAVMDGGTVRARGSFPAKAELRAMVDNGGTIDLRSMRVDRVGAAVRDGGRILTQPEQTLVATIERGGVVNYWGTPRVSSSIRNGGVVSRGSAADAQKPIPEVNPALPAVPPLPPVPPSTRGTF